ncbi:MAG: methyltransferase domain-containing protein [Candidatus Omnitrophica bacterium]|nr:methyltransferase domain-containing protein [Candidatus Omnitrophota bacterium]
MINFTFYNEKRIEDEAHGEDELASETLLEIVRNNKDYLSFLAKDYRWPILYHLSPERRNLLEWFPFKEDAALLEVEAGFGALTGLFCEKVKRVVAIESHKTQAEIIEARYSDKDNLEIVAGTMADIDFKERFDYVTLIGPLKYARYFSASKTPYRDFLAGLKRFIKPGGMLIIAVDNKFGLKYWAGSREDRTGRLFAGIEGALGNNALSFSRNEMVALLKNSGFNSLDFYYPLPDHNLPVYVYSEKRLPTRGEFGRIFANYDSDRIQLFDEFTVYAHLIEAGQFEFFANSFLIVCS